MGGVDNYWSLDLGDLEYTRVIFDQIEPEAIIHLAAISKPEKCLKNPDYSYKINVALPAFLAQYAHLSQIPFYFASSDLVFDGLEAPYSYADHPKPVNLYGKQKYEAERRILDIHPTSTVIRLPLLYGHTPGKKNFITEWADQLQQGREIIAFTDEYRSPLYVRDAMRGILKLLRKRKIGIWHFGGPERLSRYEMALQLSNMLGADPGLIIPKKQAEVAYTLTRPADLSLLSQKTISADFYARTFSKGLQSTIRRFLRYESK